MRPAAGFDDPSAGEQFVETGIAVGVDDAAKVVQMGPWMFALAVGRVEEQGRRRPRIGKRPFVAHVEPALAKAGVHNRPVLVLPVPGANTGTGVSSTCKLSPARTSAARASTSGFSTAAVAPTQPDRVEVSRFTPSRAKISAWRYSGRWSSYFDTTIWASSPAPAR